MSYNGANIRNYSRIRPTRGTGFILTRLAERPQTKREVYTNSTYGRWTPGYHSSIWAKLLDDGLVEADGGRGEVRIPYSVYSWKIDGRITYRAYGTGRNAPIYTLTAKGREVLEEMNDRYFNR